MSTPSAMHQSFLSSPHLHNHLSYRACSLCPRKCAADRTVGDRGFCGESAECRVASICPHFGEEPPLSGRRGSGTVFFSGCSARCFFCQNVQISRGNVGRAVSPLRLIEELEQLASRGVHNLNFVTPDHFLAHLEVILPELRRRGMTIPYVHNGGGYMTLETARRALPLFDIFLPDVKFADPSLASQCIADSRYPELAVSAVREMVKARGFLQPWDPSGARPAKHGVLVRHLVLPGHVDNSLAVLARLHREFGAGLPLSVMSQFRPIPRCYEHGRLDRFLAFEEYQRVCHEVERLGFERVFIQEMTRSDDYLPNFENSENPFRGNRPQDPHGTEQ